MNALRGSTILLTGGTGSFGHRVASFLLRSGPRQIRILSRDEKKQWDMRRLHPEFDYRVGDVRDLAAVRSAMRGVTYVFHAAALKQVPACESYPLEALKTNALGSENVCTAAIEAGVRAVVALSTDKAVKPVNAMGLSKAVMERIVCSKNADPSVETVFSCVRYGNVMGSRGSVIPFFRELMERGQPLAVTVPGMTRFLMTLDESVELVRHALENASGGEIFVRKAPAATVLDLARAVAKKWSPLGVDHPIEVVGIRPGEKFHEILVNEYEARRASEDATSFTIAPDYRLLESGLEAPLGWEYTSENTERLEDPDAIGALLDRVGPIEAST